MAILRGPPVGATTSRAPASLPATAEGWGAAGIALARPGRAPGQMLRGVVAPASTLASADLISAVPLSLDRVLAAPHLDLFRARDSDRILAARASILLAAIGDLAMEGSTDLATVGAEASGRAMAGVASFSGVAGVGVVGASAWDGPIGDPAGR
jgi:hypothetical protein